MANFVLVHGAWRGSSMWKQVVRLLREEGHEVYAPTLTGIANRSHLLHAHVNLSTHIEDIVSLIQHEELDDVVLCGSSYAGMVITGVADLISERIAALVYLDAFLPQDGESMYMLVPMAVQIAGLHDAALNGGYAVSPIFSEMAPGGEKDRTISSQPLATFTQALRLQGNHNKIKTKIFLMATGGQPGFGKFYDRVKNDPSWIARTIDCGHTVVQDRPNAVIDLLKEAAALTHSI